MSKIVDDLVEDLVIKEREKTQLEIVKSLLKTKKLTYQEISDIFHLSVEEIEEIDKKLLA